MSNLTYGLVSLFMAAVLAGQVISGRGLGAWWFPDITRNTNPRAYWLVVIAQSVILVAVLMSGKTWRVR